MSFVAPGRMLAGVLRCRCYPLILLGAVWGCGTHATATGSPAAVASTPNAGVSASPGASGSAASATLPDGPASSGGTRAAASGTGGRAGGGPLGSAASGPGASVRGGTGGSGGGGPGGHAGNARAGAGGSAPLAAAASAGAGAAGSTSAPEQGAAGGGMPSGPDAMVAILGADISSVHEHNYTFVDTDGQVKSVFALLKQHGFNYARVKTFVDPKAPRGYASTDNGCAGLPEAFSDRDHVVAFGQKIKAAGLGFLLDFHFSDNWADPGKQHIPAAWRGAASIDELAAHMKAYTKDVLQTALAAGARPDMVQIGNEITAGMLMHVPGPNTDCWGNHPVAAPLGGSAKNWDDFALLLRAGIEATREVDPTITVMLHIENTDDAAGVMAWVGNAVQHHVAFDVLGLSCYTAYQGSPSAWAATFAAVAKAYPELKFAIAEYNPERTRANLIMHELPDKRGLGTFLWEPTRSGDWGSALFTQQGDTLTANAADFAEFDALRPMLGL